MFVQSRTRSRDARESARRTPSHCATAVVWEKRCVCQLVLIVIIASLIYGSGCSQSDSGSEQGETSSLFGTQSYPLHAVLVYRDQKPVRLESLSIYASPTAYVRRHLAPTLKRFRDEQNRLASELSTHEASLKSLEGEANEERTAIVAEYEQRLPSEQDSQRNMQKSREPAKVLSKARSAKTKADEWYQQAFNQRIAPIEAEIARVQAEIGRLRGELSGSRDRLCDNVFSALGEIPEREKREWKTKVDGKAVIDIPNMESWTIWSTCNHDRAVGVIRLKTADFRRSIGAVSAEVETNLTQNNLVRWMLDIPEGLIGGAIHLDFDTALSFRKLKVAGEETDLPYIRAE